MKAYRMFTVTVMFVDTENGQIKSTTVRVPRTDYESPILDLIIQDRLEQNKVVIAIRK